jgi:hypothetical protein
MLDKFVLSNLRLHFSEAPGGDYTDLNIHYSANCGDFYEICCFSNNSASARSPAFLAVLTVAKNSEECATALG